MGSLWEVRQGDVLRLLLDVPECSVDAVITDAPYSSGGATRGDRTATTLTKYVSSASASKETLGDFLGDTRDQRSFAHWCALWYADCWRATKDGGLLFAFTDWRQLPATSDALQAGGWVWRGIVPWNKTEASRPQLGRPRQQCEYCLFATKGPHEAWEGAPTIAGFQPGAVPVSIKAPSVRGRVHIAEKPLQVCLELVRLVPPGGLILDPFCGSGTTGVAAIRLGRRALLFELSHEIAELARARLAAEESQISIQAATAGQAALFGGVDS